MTRYADANFRVVLGEHTDVEWRKAAAIMNGLAQTDADVVIVADADVWCDPRSAVDAVEAGAPWAVPHGKVCRLTEEATARVLDGERPTLRRLEQRPYAGYECGGVYVIRRDVLVDVPPDARFVGWGQEDQSQAAALRTLVGPPWRGSLNLWHLWHPPQARKSRTVGSDDGQALWRRYANARRKPDVMRVLVEEAKEAMCLSTAS